MGIGLYMQFFVAVSLEVIEDIYYACVTWPTVRQVRGGCNVINCHPKFFPECYEYDKFSFTLNCSVEFRHVDDH